MVISDGWSQVTGNIDISYILDELGRATEDGECIVGCWLNHGEASAGTQAGSMESCALGKSETWSCRVGF